MLRSAAIIAVAVLAFACKPAKIGAGGSETEPPKHDLRAPSTPDRAGGKPANEIKAVHKEAKPNASNTGPSNPGQAFLFGGEEYVYTYLPDRNWHLVARKSRSPVSFQYMRDYNNSLNSGASGSLDTFGLKVMLSYHEYFNNFQGF